MQYTGNQTIDNIRKETERVATKTLHDRLKPIMASLGLNELDFPAVLNGYAGIYNAIRERRPVQNTVEEILQLALCVIANQEKRIQELEDK